MGWDVGRTSKRESNVFIFITLWDRRRDHSHPLPPKRIDSVTQTIVFREERIVGGRKVRIEVCY